MNEVVLTAPLSGEKDHYFDLIKEVYLDPIRNVVVVDDEFPTLDALIAKAIDDKSGWKGDVKNAQKINEILSFCRSRRRPWLVDVHDGREVNVVEEINIAKQLHHSDLMILDYHLLGEDGSGDKAIKILKHLALNHHFNMVVVYTKGYTGGDIRRVFDEICTALTCRNFEFLLPEKIKEIEQAIGELEDENSGIGKELASLINLEMYLHERAKPGSTLGTDEGKIIREKLRANDHENTLKFKEVVSYLFDRFHNRLSSAMSEIDFGNVNFAFSEAVNWVKVDSLFVTVVNKSFDAKNLEQKLTKALEDFNPGPHQLLMAKMRAQIDEEGVIAEAAVLNDKYTQAGWLNELFDGGDQKDLIRGTVTKHWEALGDRLRFDIDAFAEKLVGNITSVGREETIRKHGGGVHTESEIVLSHINLYNSTKPINSSHLTTGHVLKFSKNDEPEKYDIWICLTPACDLVPGQKNSGWRGRLGVNVPFMAVHLTSIKISKALEKANDNIHIFLKIDGAIQAFTFCPEGNLQANPLWEQMFLLNKGKIDSDNKVSISRISDDEGGLISRTESVSVVAQLRYEYALNLLQRLGGSFSRIGLDFKAR